MRRSSASPGGSVGDAGGVRLPRGVVETGRAVAVRACSTVMFACPPRSGSLKVSRVLPYPFTWLNVDDVTELAPQIMGTNDTPGGIALFGFSPQS
jgi:hypothetical protein